MFSKSLLQSCIICAHSCSHFKMASVAKIRVNTKCAHKVSFRKSGHIYRKRLTSCLDLSLKPNLLTLPFLLLYFIKINLLASIPKTILLR